MWAVFAKKLFRIRGIGFIMENLSTWRNSAPKKTSKLTWKGSREQALPRLFAFPACLHNRNQCKSCEINFPNVFVQHLAEESANPGLPLPAWMMLISFVSRAYQDGRESFFCASEPR